MNRPPHNPMLVDINSAKSPSESSIIGRPLELLHALALERKFLLKHFATRDFTDERDCGREEEEISD